jgi:hypothetical protein
MSLSCGEATLMNIESEPQMRLVPYGGDVAELIRRNIAGKEGLLTYAATVREMTGAARREAELGIRKPNRPSKPKGQKDRPGRYNQNWNRAGT